MKCRVLNLGIPVGHLLFVGNLLVALAGRPCGVVIGEKQCGPSEVCVLTPSKHALSVTHRHAHTFGACTCACQLFCTSTAFLVVTGDGQPHLFALAANGAVQGGPVLAGLEEEQVLTCASTPRYTMLGCTSGLLAVLDNEALVAAFLGSLEAEPEAISVPLAMFRASRHPITAMCALPGAAAFAVGTSIGWVLFVDAEELRVFDFFRPVSNYVTSLHAVAGFGAPRLVLAVAYINGHFAYISPLLNGGFALGRQAPASSKSPPIWAIASSPSAHGAVVSFLTNSGTLFFSPLVHDREGLETRRAFEFCHQGVRAPDDDTAPAVTFDITFQRTCNRVATLAPDMALVAQARNGNALYFGGNAGILYELILKNQIKGGRR